MKRDSIKLKYDNPDELIAEAARLHSDAVALDGYRQIRGLEEREYGGVVSPLARLFSDLIDLANAVRSAQPGYTDSFDGVSKIRRLTWRERLTGRVRP